MECAPGRPGGGHVTDHGANWSRGYKTYRRGAVVGFVPPLGRLSVRQVSARFLSQDERVVIADLHRAGSSVRWIAQRSPSTVSRELRRNATAGNGYRPFEAHQRDPHGAPVTTSVGQPPLQRGVLTFETGP